MAENFKDNIIYAGSTLSVSGDAVAIGSTNAGAKSVIFNNTGSQGHLAWQPTDNRTINLPDSNGVVQLTGQVPGAIYDGANSISSGTIRFTNANGVSFSINGQTISGSVAAQTVQTQNLIQALYDGANSITTGTVRFSNSNGVSFGINGQTITASHNGITSQTNQTVGLYALGNTTQNSSTTLDARTLSFNGLGIITAGFSNGSIQISATQSNQTQNVVVPSAGTQTATSGTVVYSNSNNITFGMSGSSRVTASYNFNVSAGTTSNNLNAITFSNSNGLSFGLDGSTITGSYTVPTQTNQTAGLYALGNTTQNSSTTLDVRSLSFNGLGAATVGYSNGSIQLSVPVQTAQTQSLIQAIYDGANSITTGTIRFTNANGVSFSINGQTISGSVAAQTNQTLGLYAVSNTTGQSSSSTFDARSLSFHGAGVASVGYSNGSVVVSVPSGGGGITNINVSAGTTSNNLSAITFSNSNGISFGLNASTLTASHNGITSQTNQTVGLYALGNTTQNSSTTLDARTISYNGLGAMTVGYSNGSVQLSAPATSSISGTGMISIAINASTISIGAAMNVSAGTTSNNLTAVTFSNSNNVSFGINGSTITATVSQTNQTLGLYAVSNTTGQSSSSTFDARSLSFHGAGIASVGYSNGSVVVSVPAGGGGITAVNLSAGTTSNNLSAFVFSNSNNVSFGLNGSTVTATITVPAQTNQTLGLYALGNTTQNSSTTLDARSVSYNGLGGVTVGYSNGSVQLSVPNASSLAVGGFVTISTNGSSITIGGAMNFSAGTTSNNLTAVTFSNSNNVSFGINGSTITATVSQTNQTQGLYAVGNTTGQSSSSTFDARSLSFQGTGNVSVGYSNGSIVVSGGGGGGGIANAAGTQTATSGTVVFSNSNGITFGMSNSSIITASFNGTLNSVVFSNANNIVFGSAGNTTITASANMVRVSNLIWPPNPWQTNFTVSNASFSLQQFNPPFNITASQANLLMALSGNTNSSGALTISLGLYSMTGSTLTLVSSDSRQLTWTSGSQTTNSTIYGGQSGTRYRTVSLNNWSIPAGNYMLGVWFRTTNNGTWRAFGIQGPTIVGALDANETNQYFNGFSTSSYTTAMVGSINMTNTNYVRTGDNALQQPSIIFVGSV